VARGHEGDDLELALAQRLALFGGLFPQWLRPLPGRMPTAPVGFSASTPNAAAPGVRQLADMDVGGPDS